MVAQQYGRFLPQDKAEIAARILNQGYDIEIVDTASGRTVLAPGERGEHLDHVWEAA